MKIAIIENEKREVEGALDYLNFKHYGGALEFSYFETSQDFLRSNANDYSLIVVDIHLTKNSQLDGFGLIQKLIEGYEGIQRKIIVLTGFYKVEEIIKDRGLPSLPIISKPTDFKILLNTFKEKGINPANNVE